MASRVFLLDQSLVTLNQIEYVRLELTTRFWQTDTIKLTLQYPAAGAEQGNLLYLPDESGGLVFLIETREDIIEASLADVVVTGRAVDGFVATERIVIPDTGQAYDSQTGVSAETAMKYYVRKHAGVNAVAARQVPNLVTAPDLGRGASVSQDGRFQYVGELLVEAALKAGLGWKTTMSGGQLVFDVIEGTDRQASVFFAFDFGTLNGWEMIASAVDSKTYALIAGQGELTERDLVESGGQTGFARREAFLDARDVELGNTPLLTQRAEAFLAEAGATTSTHVDVNAFGAFVYGVDWFLGDIVLLRDARRGLNEIARVIEVTKVYEGSDTPTVTAQVGKPFPGASSIASGLPSSGTSDHGITGAEVDQQIVALQIGGANLIRNSSFENVVTASDWTVGTNWTAPYAASTAYGSKVARVQLAAQTAGDLITQFIPVVRTDDYWASWWSYLSARTSGIARATVAEYDAGGGLLQSTNVDLVAAQAGWTRHSLHFGPDTTTPGRLAFHASTTQIRISFKTPAAATLTWHVDAAQFEQSSLLTSYAPAPYELVDGSITTEKMADLAITLAKLADLSVSNAKIVAGAVDAVKLADDAVSAAKIQTGAVLTAKLADNAVSLAKLGALSVDTSKIVDAAISTAKIAGGAVTDTKIAAGAVGSTHLVDGAVLSAKIADNAVVLAKLAANSVDTAKLVDDAITAAKIAAAAVGSSEIADGAVIAAKIADANLTTAKFAAGIRPVAIVGALPTLPDTLYPIGSVVFLTTDKKLYRNDANVWIKSVDGADLTADSVGSAAIGPSAVTSSELAALAVTTAKIAASAVTATEIGANAVIAGKIATDAVTSTTIASGAVTSAKIADTAVTVAKFAAGLRPVEVLGALPAAGTQGRTVLLTTDNKLYRDTGSAWTAAVPTTDLTGTIASGQIADGAVLSAKLADGSVALAKLAANSVDTTKMVDDAVTAAKIAASAVGTSEIADNAVVTAKIADANLTVAKFAAGLRPVEILGALPAAGTQGRMVLLTTDNKLYRDTGAAWTVAVPTTDLTGTIASAQIADGAVLSAKLADGSVALAKLAANSVDTTKMVDDAVTAAKIAANAVGSSEIADAAVITAKIADANLTTAKFAAGIRPVGIVGTLPTLPDALYPIGAVVFLTTDKKLYRNDANVWIKSMDGADITARTVAAGAIVADSLTAGEIAAGAITTTELAAGAVTAAKITAGTITATEIAAATITGAKIAATTIAAGNIVAGTITTTQIATDTILAGNIAAGAVATSELAAGAVTAAKITAGTITTTEIAALTILAGNIAAAAITTAKLAAGAVTANEIAANTITAGQIAADTITAGQIAAGAVSTSELAAGAVTAAKITAGTITATEIAANAITAAKIAAGTITTTHLTAGFRQYLSNPNPLNAIKNAGFEAATTRDYWTNSGGTWTVVADGTKAHTGNNYLQGVSVAATYAESLAAGDDGAVTYFEVNPGDVIQFGGWAYRESGDANVRMMLVARDKDLGTPAYTSTASVTTAAWTFISGTYTVPAGKKYVTIECIIVNDGTLATTARFDDLYMSVQIPGAGIVASSITAAQIAADTITAGQIAAGAVATSELAAGAVTAAKITAGTITTTELAALTILAGNIAAGAITTAKIAANAVTANEIAANTITAAQIAADTITAGQIAAGAITAAEIAAGSITATKLAVFDTAKVFSEVWQTSDSINDWQNFSGSGEMSIVADAGTQFGGNALQVGNNSGNDMAWLGHTRLIPFDPNALYRLRIRLRRSLGTGLVYCGWVGVAANGTTLVNATGGASSAGQHYHCAAGSAPGATYTEYEGYTRGYGAPNGTSTVGTMASPGTMHSSVRYLRPLILVNYSAVAGTTFVDQMTVDIVAGGTLIEDGSITTTKIAALAVTANEIAADTITAGQIAANAVGVAELVAGAVTTAKIAAGAVTATEIAAGAVIAGKIGALAITAAEIAAGAITTAKIAANAVTATEINAGAVTTAKIAAGAVTANEIAANTITAAQIAADTITAGQIAAGAVATSELAAGAVTAAKITAATITATEIAAATITGAKIAAATIAAGNIVAGTITTTQIAADTIVAGNIAAGAVAVSELAAGAVTTAKIAAGNVTATEIAAGAITTAKLAAGAVTANEIAANAITSEKLLLAGSNLVPNSDFATGDMSGWRKWSSPAQQTVILSTDASVPAGATSRYVVNFAPNGATGVSAFASVKAYSDAGADKDGIAVAPGEIYRVYIDAVKDASYNPSGVSIIMYFYKTDGTWTTSISTINILPTLSTSWQTFTGAFTAPAGSVRCWPYVYSVGATAGNLWWTRLQVLRQQTGELIVDGTITATEIAADTITAGNIAANAIGTSELAAGAVTAAKITAGTITATEIAATTITAAKIANDTLTSNQIAAGAITASEIAAGAVTTAKILAGNVTATEIATDTIVASNVAANAITASEIAAGAVTTAKISAGNVTATEIAAGAVTTDKIAANAIVAGKIAAGEIGTSHFSATASISLVSNAGATVVIDASGITISDGALTLQDEFGKASISSSGFDGSWADYIRLGLYNARFTVVTTGALALGRTADLPYWDLVRSAGTPSFTGLAGGGVKVTFGALNDRASIFADVVPVRAGSSMELGAAMKANWVAGTIEVTVYSYWQKADGTDSSTPFSAFTRNYTASATSLTWITQDVVVPDDAAQAIVVVAIKESGTHNAGNYLSIYGVELIETRSGPTVTVVTSGTGTWTPKSRSKMAYVAMWGAGGGGGSGACNGSGAVRGGGTGGGGGGFVSFEAVLVSGFGISYGVGVGGTGGAAVGPTAASGNDGTAGTYTWTGFGHTAYGGGGGKGAAMAIASETGGAGGGRYGAGPDAVTGTSLVGGSPASVAGANGLGSQGGGSSSTASGGSAENGGGGGGGHGTGAGSNHDGGDSVFGGGGGGAGGTGGASQSAGSAGGGAGVWNDTGGAGASGGAVRTNGDAGADGSTASSGWGGEGGGGGGGSSSNTVNAGDGGNGGAMGGGGGGGGAGTSAGTAKSGKGGDGGNGAILFVEW